MVREQADTDRAWRLASEGYMRMEKITYRSSRGDLEIPAFVFQPLTTRGARGIRRSCGCTRTFAGISTSTTSRSFARPSRRGYVVIAPEYRGSIGYGRTFYDAIDYGGAEVEDVVTAVAVLKNQYPDVAPDQIGIIGWSHGGLIALLSIFRNPTTFRAAAALEPVTNLFHRLARKGWNSSGARSTRRTGLAEHRPSGQTSTAYRSPLFHVDDLRIPLLVHIADNDEDVNIDEAMPLIDALRARKPELSDVKVYRSPPGGHLFDRRVNPTTRQPENTPDMRDAWTRIWNFFDAQLEPPSATR